MSARSLSFHLTTVACLVAASVSLLAQETGAANQASLAYANVATNLNSIRTFAEAPKNFNPVTASDEDLAVYGFPARPDPQAEPDHYAMWQRAMQAAKIHWNGTLTAVRAPMSASDSMLAGTEMTASEVSESVPATPASLNWAGVVLTKNLTKWSKSSSFRDIYSFMTVPVGQPAFGGGCDFYSQFTFVGLNGYLKKAAFQPSANGTLMGGVFALSECSRADAAYYAVFGWNPTFIQTAFKVNPGDMVYTEVGAPPSGTQPSYLFIEDLTTLTYNAYAVSVPSEKTFIGDTAEWIVERRCCRTSGYPFPLLNTIDNFFDGGAALDNAKNTLYPGSQATSTEVLTMRDDDNDQNIELIYQGSAGYEGKHSLLLQTTGCAFSGPCVKR
jgi:Peptidase A4 family